MPFEPHTRMHAHARPLQRTHGAIAPNGRRGFTLIECLVTGIVLAVFGAALVGGVMQSILAADSAKEMQRAAGYLDDVFTKIDYVGPSTLMAEGPLEGELEQGYAWQAQITQEELSDLYTVTVTLEWPSRGRMKSTQATTQLYDELGMRPTGRAWEDLDG